MTTESHGCKPETLRLLERGVVGSVIGGDALPSQLGITAKELTDPLCSHVLSVCERLEEEHAVIDYAAVCMADETLDAALVHEIWEQMCVSSVLIARNVEKLRDAALMRRFRALLQQALDAKGDTGEQITSLRDQLSAMLEQNAASQLPGVNMLEMIVQILGEIECLQQKAEPVGTGIAKLDECLCGGFRPGDLVVVAALTSVGKSAMLAFMMRSAAEAGKRILLISCEMSDVQNAERYMASCGGVPIQKLIGRKALTDDENVRLCDGLDRYHPENIQMVSSGTQTAQSIRRAANMMKASGGLDMIVVDYLQRLNPSRSGGNRADEVGAVAAALKALAVDLNVPVLTAAQFNREAARGRSEAKGCEELGVPALHQLRDSSQIEDEANEIGRAHV